MESKVLISLEEFEELRAFREQSLAKAVPVVHYPTPGCAPRRVAYISENETISQLTNDIAILLSELHEKDQLIALNQQQHRATADRLFESRLAYNELVTTLKGLSFWGFKKWKKQQS